MSLNKLEERTIRNIIERLQEPNCGCSNGMGTEKAVEQCNALGIEAVSRLYLDTWVIPALKRLLPGDPVATRLAADLSER